MDRALASGLYPRMYVNMVGTGLKFTQVQNKSHLLALSRVSKKKRFSGFHMRVRSHSPQSEN